MAIPSPGPSIVSAFLIFVMGLCCASFAQNNSHEAFTFPPHITSDDYLEGTIIFKMKVETAPWLKNQAIDVPEVQTVLKSMDATGLKKMFPLHQPPTKSHHVSGQEYADLSRIYSTTIPKGESLEDAINKLIQTGVVEYAEPWYIPQTFFEPNDPFTGSQFYLQTIKAYEAWAITRGDTNVVIAITDTGIDLDHPDLRPNIAFNYNDPINGQDSDNDGYIDNFHGWDLGNNDNNPQWENNAHGVHVSGIAGAAANNGTGIAGVGFNSRILPIKISDRDGRLVRAYEGIVYAADRGAGVINCSWGGAMSPGQFGQDIINYAVLNRDAVVIASAGNSNNQIRIFPASFVNAVSVAATDNNDVKWNGSSFGKGVDISAPGANIFSTWPNGSYVASSGTSMAAPVVAGAAALVRARFPGFNALQVAAQLKITADNIDTIPGNSQYEGMLGTGRLNIYRALTETHHPYLLFRKLQYPGEHYQLYNPGQSFDLGVEFINLLASAGNMTAQLSTTSNFVEIVSASSFLGEVPSSETTNNFNNPFCIRIKENIPASHEITFSISFFSEKGIYAGQQSFSMTFNLDYLDFHVNQIKTTVNSRGNVGYNYPNYNQGVGMLYASANQNRSLLKAGGLMAGTSTSSVVDNVYGPMENSFTNSFYSVENAREVAEPAAGNKMIRGSFTDSLAGLYKIGLKVDYRIYAFEEAPLDKFMILEYDIINTSQENKPGFYAGFFADWSILDVRNHRATFDPENRMGYAFSASGGNFTGIQLLSHSNVRHYAFDNQGFGGSLKISDGFTSFEKYTAMKSNRDNAGFFDIDNDISTLISAGPFNLPSKDTLRVAFALLAGDHLNDLQNSANLAMKVYKGDYVLNAPSAFKTTSNLKAYPNPVSGRLNINLQQGYNSDTRIEVFDLSMRRIYSHSTWFFAGNNELSIDTASWPAGTYFLQVRNEREIFNIKIVKIDD